jgi:hypothetical protein
MGMLHIVWFRTDLCEGHESWFYHYFSLFIAIWREGSEIVEVTPK